MPAVKVEGMPKDRPTCPWCRKPLPYWSQGYTAEGKPTMFRRDIVRKVWKGWNAYKGLFCRLTCALGFATAAYHAGYRRERGES